MEVAAISASKYEACEVAGNARRSQRRPPRDRSQQINCTPQPTANAERDAEANLFDDSADPETDPHNLPSANFFGPFIDDEGQRGAAVPRMGLASLGVQHRQRILVQHMQRILCVLYVHRTFSSRAGALARFEAGLWVAASHAGRHVELRHRTDGGLLHVLVFRPRMQVQ
jgi:hypothetical protein